MLACARIRWEICRWYTSIQLARASFCQICPSPVVLNCRPPSRKADKFEEKWTLSATSTTFSWHAVWNLGIPYISLICRLLRHCGHRRFSSPSPLLCPFSVFIAPLTFVHVSFVLVIFVSHFSVSWFPSGACLSDTHPSLNRFDRSLSATRTTIGQISLAQEGHSCVHNGELPRPGEI